MRSPTERRVLLATRSRDKAREIQQILRPLVYARFLSLDDAGIPPSPEEDAVEAYETFLDNARAKAAYFFDLAGIPTIADDSGISVDALGGEPGVRSRRFAAGNGLDGQALDTANNTLLLERLRGVPAPERRAFYSCAAVWYDAGRERTAVATRSGSILPAPRGSHGFGYDPLFLDPDSGLSFGELDPVMKNRTSHRARAFRALASLI